MKLPFGKKKRSDDEDEDDLELDLDEDEEEDDDDLEDDIDLDPDEAGEDGDGPGRNQIILVAVLAGLVVTSIIGGAGWFLLGRGGEEVAQQGIPAPASTNDGTSISLDLAPAGPAAGGDGQAAPSLNALMESGDAMTDAQAAEMAAAREAEAAAMNEVLDEAAEVRADGGFLGPEGEISASQVALQEMKSSSLNALGGLNATGAPAPDQGRVVPFTVPTAFRLPAMNKEPEALPKAPDLSVSERDAEGRILPIKARSGQGPLDIYARPFERENDGMLEVAIMVTDIGLSRAASQTVIRSLPPEIGLVISPYARDPEDWMIRARLAGHEVYVGLPMESRDFPREDAGPLALLSGVQVERNTERLREVLALFPGYVGVYTMFGSKFGVAEGQLRVVLAELRDRGLLLVDSGETGAAAMSRIAAEINLPRVLNNLILDDRLSEILIAGQLKRMENFAQSQQVVMGTIRPYPVSLKLVSDWLTKMDTTKYRLVPPSALTNRQFIQQ